MWREWCSITVGGDLGELLLRASDLELGLKVGKDFRVEGTSE